MLPEGWQGFNRLFLHRGVPQQPNRGTIREQAETQVQVIGDRVFIETTRSLQLTAIQQLTIASQLHHASTPKATLLQQGIKRHLHGLHPCQPAFLGIRHRFPELHSRPASPDRKWDQALEHIGLELGIGVKHQHPVAFELLQNSVQSTGFTSASATLAMNHLKLRVLLLQVVQQGAGAIFTAVIHHPKGETLAGVTKGRQTLNEPGDHSLLITGRHHHIHRGQLNRNIRG